MTQDFFSKDEFFVKKIRGKARGVLHVALDRKNPCVNVLSDWGEGSCYFTLPELKLVIAALQKMETQLAKR